VSRGGDDHYERFRSRRPRLVATPTRTSWGTGGETVTAGAEGTTSNDQAIDLRDDQVIDLRDDQVIDLRDGVFYGVEGPDGQVSVYDDLRAVLCRPASPETADQHLSRMLAAAHEATASRGDD